MSRRNGMRNRFKIDRNYALPLLCIIITCVTIVTCTLIVINTKKEANKIIDQNSLNQYVQNTDKDANINITDEERVQINKLISFLISNLDTSKDLTDEKTKFNIVVKYYLNSNNSQTIPNESISQITPEVYRNLGYVYFDDFKEDYQYISEEGFKQAYKELFNIEKYSIDNYKDYYIENLKGYVIPKNNEIKQTNLYKLNQVNSGNTENSISINMVEINLYKLYETLSLEEINNYLNNPNIDKDSLTGNLLSVKLIKQDNRYVFDGYGGI